jgi:hypothetical protein
MTQRNFRVRNGLTIDGTTSGSSSFASTATGTDLSYVLPGSAGASSTVLTNDGSGNLSWALPGGGGSTFGNITIAVDTDNTISTTSGDLVLDSASGTVSINVPTITTDATTLALFNTTATTVNAFGAATTISIGANTGTTTINNSLVADDISVTTVDTTNLEVTNIKAKDGTAAMVIADSTGIVTVSTALNVDNLNINGNTITTSTGNLILDSTSGTIIMNSNGTLGVTLTPIAGQTPNAVFNGNIVKGPIRNATTEAAGGVWSYLSGTGALYKGLSIDNSVDEGRGSIAVLRGYAGSSTAKASFIGEVASGTFATPTAITSGTVLSEFVGNGYTGSNWASDTIASGLPGMSVTATQTWSSFTSTGSSISGTTLTIGTLTSGTVAAGQMIYGSGVTTATSIVSGSGSTWTVDKSQTVGPIAITGGSNGTRLLVRAQTQNTRIGGIVSLSPTGTTPVSIIDHQPTAATYIADAWTFRSRPLNTGGTNTTLMTLDATGNAVHAGDVAVNGGDLTTTQTTATLFNTTATTLNVGQAATTVSLGATTGTATIRNATTALTGVLRVNGNDIQSSTGAVVMSMSTNDATFADVVQVNGILNVRSGLTYNMLSTTAGASENTLTILKQDAAASADHAVINFATYRSTAGTYSPTQNGDKLGEFKFNGQYASGASPTSGVPSQIISNATENWTATANGAAIQFWGTKAGTTTGVNVINANPETMFIRSDSITLQDSSNVNLVGSKITYNRVYGQWQYDATITPVAANTAYAFPWQGTNAVTDFANIASATNTSRIQPNALGFYNLQFSIQLENTDNAADHTAYIWWRKNGVDIPASMGRVYVTKQHQTISSWNNTVEATATTDYFELMYAVDDVALVFPYFAATAFGPSTAATFLTIQPVGA